MAMAKIKVWLFGLIIGLLLGLWGGVNIGKGRPLYANPFAQTPLPDRLRDVGRDAVRESGDALQKAGEALKSKAEDESEH